LNFTAISGTESGRFFTPYSSENFSILVMLQFVQMLSAGNSLRLSGPGSSFAATTARGTNGRESTGRTAARN
jgi:hypothetical protein